MSWVTGEAAVKTRAVSRFATELRTYARETGHSAPDCSQRASQAADYLKSDPRTAISQAEIDNVWAWVRGNAAWSAFEQAKANVPMVDSGEPGQATDAMNDAGAGWGAFASPWPAQTAPQAIPAPVPAPTPDAAISTLRLALDAASAVSAEAEQRTFFATAANAIGAVPSPRMAVMISLALLTIDGFGHIDMPDSLAAHAKQIRDKFGNVRP